jgi:hypothetical protein
MIPVPLLNPKFAKVPAEKRCELRVRGTDPSWLGCGRLLSAPQRLFFAGFPCGDGKPLKSHL